MLNIADIYEKSFGKRKITKRPLKPWRHRSIRRQGNAFCSFQITIRTLIKTWLRVSYNHSDLLIERHDC
jgi:hypothetical protein